MAKILLLDNYDSFTYNLFHYVEELSEDEITVIRNDELDLSSLNDYDSLIISPGPGLPQEAGQLMQVLSYYINARKKILGVCLGQQAIAVHYGYRLKNLNQVVHGKASQLEISRTSHLLFRGLPKRFEVGRYHSWVVELSNQEGPLTSIAEDSSGNCMALAHESLPIMAVQFHPESVLTNYGKTMLKNWLES